MEQKTREVKIQFKYIVFTIIAIAIVIAIIFAVRNAFRKSKTNGNSVPDQPMVVLTPRSDEREINFEQIVAQNEQEVVTEKIERQNVEIEYMTQYRENSSLISGQMQTLQEGQNGSQDAVVRNTYKNGQLISTSLISSVVTKPSIDKVVEVGTGTVASTYTPIVGDLLEIISNGTILKVTPADDAEEVTTLNSGDQVTMKLKQNNWYCVSRGETVGWLKSGQVRYINPNEGNNDDMFAFSKEELTRTLGFSMLLNTRSGLTLEQFKKILSNDPNDTNKIFEQNAEYFYYVEQQYNVNGVFVAAVGIHESGWGRSAISLEKQNLFGYGAYDRDPYGMAKNFDSYAGGIDLVARVFMKYYLNPEGTPLYNGEVAEGTYYHGSTLTSVNQSYATDKNWANGVFKWMTYLYNKL